MKNSTSLQKKYLLIILIAIVLIPITFPLISGIFTISWMKLSDSEPYYDKEKIEKIWNEKAILLSEEKPEDIKKVFRSVQKSYPKASMFWVDSQGKAHFPFSKQPDIPTYWTVDYLIDFMKNRNSGNLYTVVNNLGKGKKEAFMIIQIPKKYTDYPVLRMQEKYGTIFLIVVLLVLVTFIIFSWMFFRDINTRLVRLQKAMQITKKHSIPKQITLSKMDEIGLLEQSFNSMVQIIEESRAKELEEEGFRKELIANLSHDLRTPLMVLRTQINSLEKEPLSVEGREIILIIDHKINYISDLIDNLFSYSLLTSKKYPFNPSDVNITPLLRGIIASWYNTLEEKGFYIDIEIPEQNFYWNIDSNWFQRIMDNIIQNVIRHAADGKFIGVHISKKDNKEIISIVDHGPGIQNGDSSNKGAEIGLSTIALMAKEMHLSWNITSDQYGTTFSITKI
ncbi:HAMP domain-containing sensor histidine kinase [Bacillus pseudomycoides]|uniref:HAMP domain-containing sensor histidine kinase n=1 Tax=Bacillus pseudomycoides TaxID=64104 RepID=UPI000BEB9199|nr:HAMP domain-containing sensor histidine kinase [Bacillus pseudomycoides]PEE39687.1 two-component sensor histidine kinase [Bacillus pseudomycoides]PGA93965.1 two-component sensor histidine kinase [Bacillus pseudomycoides]PHF35402.1 two-component sensor histidine kinase [Bacillus pseudomycoides]